MTFRVLLGILLLLLLPSARLHVFDGLPVSGLAEFAAFFLILPFCVSSALRRMAARMAAARPRVPRLAIGAVVVLAIAAKLVLYFAAGTTGFAACYKPGQAADPNATACERSYENPFFRGGVTRFDDEISFDPATWNLSFFNSLRFNFLPWEKGLVDHRRLPFTAQWRGQIDSAAPQPIAVTYAGEGTLRIDGLPAMPLPPAYRRAETVTVTAPAGPRALVLEYGCPRRPDSCGNGCRRRGFS